MQPNDRNITIYCQLTGQTFSNGNLVTRYTYVSKNLPITCSPDIDKLLPSQFLDDEEAASVVAVNSTGRGGAADEVDDAIFEIVASSCSENGADTVVGNDATDVDEDEDNTARAHFSCGGIPTMLFKLLLLLLLLFVFNN